MQHSLKKCHPVMMKVRFCNIILLCVFHYKRICSMFINRYIAFKQVFLITLKYILSLYFLYSSQIYKLVTQGSNSQNAKKTVLLRKLNFTYCITFLIESIVPFAVQSLLVSLFLYTSSFVKY